MVVWNHRQRLNNEMMKLAVNCGLLALRFPRTPFTRSARNEARSSLIHLYPHPVRGLEDGPHRVGTRAKDEN